MITDNFKWQVDNRSSESKRELLEKFEERRNALQPVLSDEGISNLEHMDDCITYIRRSLEEPGVTV